MKRPVWNVCVSGWLLCCAWSAAAETGQAPAKEPPASECRWADTPPVIDGKVDDTVWQQAQVIDRFTLPWLQDKERPSRTATRARLLWDRDSLYFFAEMEDSDLYADITEHDGSTWDNDVFELFFKPAEDKPGYYEFQVNAAGTTFDMFLPRRGAGGTRRFVKDGDFQIVSKVTHRGTLNKWQDKDEGWSVEGKIPWTGWLRTGGRPEPGEVWRYALCRYDYSVDFEGPEFSTCAPLNGKNYPDFHSFEDYLPLKFVGPNKQAWLKRLGLDGWGPVATSKVTGSPDPYPPYRVTKAYPQLKLSFPIAVKRVPETDWLLVIQQGRPYAETVIGRMRDVPDATQVEEILPLKETAYGIAFHPQFAKNHWIYVGGNGAGSPGFKGKTTRVTRYVLELPECRIDPKSAQVIIEWESDGHNGGDLAFGPDGMLYISSGDGTSDSDTNVTGQDLTKLLAKVLRIDVDHPAPKQQYSVPKDNPFVGQADVRPETWAYGFRNPWRLSIDSRGRVWVGNNGQDLWEQAYLVEKGANYGWSVMEGSHPFYLDRKPGPTPFSKPIAEHPHSDARSLTGGLVYEGAKFPELRGAYIYGDYSTGKIWGLLHDGEKVVWNRLLADTTLQISGFGVDSQGELLVADHRGGEQGHLYRFEPHPQRDASPSFPQKLSETGLFAAVKGHKVVPGLLPYSVNAPLWSDGAHKERFLALVVPPGEEADYEPTIGFTRKNAWTFPDGTVLVKSFALDQQVGKPESRRWIETRLLTRQEGEWVGYSYLWNDEQTEATLVAAEGLDWEYTIRNADGTERQQSWHYPSRTECMVCHSRAANYLLGLSELQMNKVHEYPQGAANQLEVLEALGVLRLPAHGDLLAGLREELKDQGLDEAAVKQKMDELTATRLQRTAAGESRLLSFTPARYKRLVNPYDPQQDLAARARSYLHSNCAACHVAAGGGNAQFDADFLTKLSEARLIDEKPQHHSFATPEARLIAPGDPARSILLQRLSRRGTGSGQMPQLATSLVDQGAVDLFTEWIQGLKQPEKTGSQ